MIGIKTEKDYLIKVVNYKGKEIKLKAPKRKSDYVTLSVSLCRLYERAKTGGFLTRDLLEAMKKLANAIVQSTVSLHLLIKNPPVLRALKRITLTQIENGIEEEIIYGKIREHERETCRVCGCDLVYPAYIAQKKGEEIIKISEPIGIKCLNHIKGKIEDIVREIKISSSCKTFTVPPEDKKETQITLF